MGKMTNEYMVKIATTEIMLGTNPIGLDVMDKHILDKQRKLIAEKSTINKAINKYLGAKDISDDQVKIELQALENRVVEIMGRELSEAESVALREGEFKNFKELMETITELKDKGITCFFRVPEGAQTLDPMQVGVSDLKGTEFKEAIGSHMIPGFLKAAAEALSRASKSKRKGTMIESASYTHEIINQHVTIKEKFIVPSEGIAREEDGKPVYLQRSLRAKTAQGPRISLAKSEYFPAGVQMQFTIKVLKDSPMTQEILEKLLSYGEIKGLGQWRNSGKGAFEVIEFQKM